LSCPFCGTKIGNPIKEWKYGHNYFTVKSFKCTHCGLDFRVYYHENKLSHTIPQSPSNQFKIDYLLSKGTLSREKIALRLNLSIKEVAEVLSKKEK
jgi:hypothetical protein